MSTAILSKSHASAADKQLCLCLVLKSLQSIKNVDVRLQNSYLSFDTDRQINAFRATNALNGRNV